MYIAPNSSSNHGLPLAYISSHKSTTESNTSHPSFNPKLLPLSWRQRAFLCGSSGILALLNTYRGDMVAMFGETAPFTIKALEGILMQMNETKEGKALIHLQPRLDQSSMDFQFLRSLPTNTFGFAYVKMMDTHEYEPESRDEVRYIPSDKLVLAYVLQRYREIHDFWHVLTGLPTTVEGEVFQKWFEWEITKLPLCLVSGTLGSLRLTQKQQQDLVQYVIPWAKISSKVLSEPLMAKCYENYFEMDLEEFRKELGIITFQDYLKKEKH